MRALTTALAAACLLAAGCKTKPDDGATAGTDRAAARPPAAAKPPQPPLLNRLFARKPKPPAAQPAEPIGQIRQLNFEGRFALIDAGGSVSAAAGTTLITISQGTQTSELKLTDLRSPPFLIADILSGKPAVGERVYRKQ